MCSIKAVVPYQAINLLTLIIVSEAVVVHGFWLTQLVGGVVIAS